MPRCPLRIDRQLVKADRVTTELQQIIGCHAKASGFGGIMRQDEVNISCRAAPRRLPQLPTHSMLPHFVAARRMAYRRVSFPEQDVRPDAAMLRARTAQGNAVTPT